MRNETPPASLPMDAIVNTQQAIEEQKTRINELATARQPLADAWTRLVELEEALEGLFGDLSAGPKPDGPPPTGS